MGGREGGSDRGREGGREGGRGGKEGGEGREGWRDGGMEGWREGGRREGGREAERSVDFLTHSTLYTLAEYYHTTNVLSHLPTFPHVWGLLQQGKCLEPRNYTSILFTAMQLHRLNQLC